MWSYNLSLILPLTHEDEQGINFVLGMKLANLDDKL